MKSVNKNQQKKIYAHRNDRRCEAGVGGSETGSLSKEFKKSTYEQTKWPTACTNNRTCIPGGSNKRNAHTNDRMCVPE